MNRNKKILNVTMSAVMAAECAFALFLTKVTKPPYPAKISYNRHSWRKYKLCAISGTLFRRRGEEHNDEKND